MKKKRIQYTQLSCSKCGTTYLKEDYLTNEECGYCNYVTS